MSQYTETEIEQIYDSDYCRCDGKKTVGQFFCPGCYHSLPKWMQTRLHRKFGQGLKKAFHTANDHLDGLNTPNNYKGAKNYERKSNRQPA